MANTVKAKLRLKKKVKSTMVTRWDDSEPIVTSDTAELFIGMGETVDAIKISDFLMVDNLPLVGIENKIYVLKSNRQGYYWNGTKFVVIAGNGGVESFSTFASLPSTGIKNTFYVVKTDESFYPTTETSVYVWDDFNSKFLLVSRAKATSSFSEIKVDGISIVASNTKDTINLKAGTGITIMPDTSTKTITITINKSESIPATIHKKTYPIKGGVMSATLNTALGSGTTAIINDNIYMFAGYNGSAYSTPLQCYNVTTNTCSTLCVLPSARGNAMANAYNGNIYIAGGWSGSASLKEFWMYDTAANTFVSKPNMFVQRNASFKALIGDKLWIIGGCSASSTSTGTIEYYDFTLDCWIQVDSSCNMPTPRYGGATFIFGNKIYCCGGYTGSAYSVKVEVFDTDTMTWDTTKANMPVSRYASGYSTYNGLGYVFAGTQSSTYTKTTYVYNPDADLWFLKENMTTARMWGYVERYNNTFYILGGQTSPSAVTNTIEAYSVASEKVNGFATINMLYPTGNVMLNTSTGESAKYLGLNAGEVWHYGSYTNNAFKAIITEVQS